MSESDSKGKDELLALLASMLEAMLAIRGEQNSVRKVASELIRGDRGSAADILLSGLNDDKSIEKMTKCIEQFGRLGEALDTKPK